MNPEEPGGLIHGLAELYTTEQLNSHKLLDLTTRGSRPQLMHSGYSQHLPKPLPAPDVPPWPPRYWFLSPALPCQPGARSACQKVSSERPAVGPAIPHSRQHPPPDLWGGLQVKSVDL